MSLAAWMQCHAWVFLMPCLLTARAAGSEVAIASDGAELRGELLLPVGSKPSAAIVFLHGSGCGTREDLKPLAREAVSRGFAAVVFDKRGCGASTGDFARGSLRDLATDANAVGTWLVAENVVDPSRVGLWGVSNSGWIGPVAVGSPSSPFRFLVVTTGGGATPQEVERHGYTQRLVHNGFDPERTTGATDLIDRYFEYLSTGQGYEEVLAQIAQVKENPWYSALALDRVLPNLAERPAWQWVADYDPAPDIARLRIPTLVLLGGRDELTPVAIAMQRWTAGLAESGVPSSRLVLFPSAGHGITLGGHHWPPPQTIEFAPGYIEEVAGWVSVALAGGEQQHP